MIPYKCVKPTTYKGKLYYFGDKLHANKNITPPYEFFRHPNGSVAKNILPKNKTGSIILVACGPSAVSFSNPDSLPVAVVNRAGITLNNSIAHWFCLHPWFFALWRNKRNKNNLTTEGISYISDRLVRNPVITLVKTDAHKGGSSLFAIRVLEMMGYERIYMYGIDLMSGYKMFRPCWEEFTTNGAELVVKDGSDWMKRWCDKMNKHER